MCFMGVLVHSFYLKQPEQYHHHEHININKFNEKETPKFNEKILVGENF